MAYLQSVVIQKDKNNCFKYGSPFALGLTLIGNPINARRSQIEYSAILFVDFSSAPSKKETEN